MAPAILATVISEVTPGHEGPTLLKRQPAVMGTRGPGGWGACGLALVFVWDTRDEGSRPLTHGTGLSFPLPDLVYHATVLLPPELPAGVDPAVASSSLTACEVHSHGSGGFAFARITWVDRVWLTGHVNFS